MLCTRRACGQLTYVPSDLELDWTTNSSAGRICAIASTAKQLAGAELWLNYTRASAGRWPTEAESTVLSRFDSPDGSKEFIEPLSGMARHPLARVGCKNINRSPRAVSIMDPSYLIPYSKCTTRGERPHHNPHNRAQRKNIFFDLGCSNPGRWVMPSDLDRDAVFGLAAGVALPSLPFFVGLYSKGCIAFDHIYAWEASTSVSPTQWWEHVPLQVRARLHWFNVPVAGDDGSASSAIALLHEVARPEDFVAIKVDIDGGPELEIVRGILGNASTLALVDEIFFEFHFWFDNMDFGWNTRKGGKNWRKSGHYTVDDALRLFRQFRERGVRAHFWI